MYGQRYEKRINCTTFWDSFWIRFLGGIMQFVFIFSFEFQFHISAILILLFLRGSYFHLGNNRFSVRMQGCDLLSNEYLCRVIYTSSSSFLQGSLRQTQALMPPSGRGNSSVRSEGLTGVRCASDLSSSMRSATRIRRLRKCSAYPWGQSSDASTKGERC